MKRSRADKIFDIVNISFMLLVLFVMLYPIYFTIIASFSEPWDVATGKVVLLPRGFTLAAYSNVFKNADIWMGYLNSIYYTVAGTLLNLALTLPTAYVLSKRRLHGRTALSWFFLFTMFFGGGLIPTYLLVRDLNLLNKPHTLVVLGGISVYLVVVTRIFYQTTIPEELYEAAHVDGCSDFAQFFRIALPLSLPIVAVMALFYAVGRWNDFMTALIYISDKELYPLQLVLRNILVMNQTALDTVSITSDTVLKDAQLLDITKRAYMAQAMKYSLIFISSAPMLAAYPFVQKHFVKGVLIGSLKG